MKRLHIHVGVKDIEKSVQFYSTLFGQKPSKLKSDYAKWMLEDPRINFAVSTLTGTTGVDHLGIQVDEPKELEELTERLKNADLGVSEEGETTCCYAKSDKAWVEDPAGVPWEAYRTMADVEVFKEKGAEASECCPTDDGSQTGCC
ncbi:MAG: VOC family protein [Bdellovibrionales bacterium]|nr:VOC family protein [Bdellovibrionales bacterium]